MPAVPLASRPVQAVIHVKLTTDALSRVSGYILTYARLATENP